MLVDITASASRPGTRKSAGLEAIAPKKINKTSGTTMVMSRLSPRRRLRISSMRIWAANALISTRKGIVWPMAQPEQIKRVVPRITDEEAHALATWYSSIAAAVGKFPAADMKNVEPPLRSVAAPRNA